MLSFKPQVMHDFNLFKHLGLGKKRSHQESSLERSQNEGFLFGFYEIYLQADDNLYMGECYEVFVYQVIQAVPKLHPRSLEVTFSPLEFGSRELTIPKYGHGLNHQVTKHPFGCFQK